MPEGDTIHRTAVRLRAALENQQIVRARSSVASNFERIEGSTIVAIKPHGKHLLIQLGDGWSIHSHMGMTGSWHLYRPGEQWRKPEHRAHAIVDTGGFLAICFTPKLLELLSPTALKRHPYLHQLGPDVLGTEFSVEEVVQRLRSEPSRPLGVAIMDQRLVSGVGNIYKSELLFIERLCPFAPVGDVPVARLTKLVERAQALMRINLDNAARRTRFRLDGRRFWVYGRSGQPCFECATPIAVRRQSDLGRTTYYCPNCQAPEKGLRTRAIGE